MFSSSAGISIEGNQHFYQANRDIIINNNLSNEESSRIRGQGYDGLMPIQDQYREFGRGDIIIRSEVHSSEMVMTIAPRLKPTNPFRPVKTVKIRRKMYSVELVNFHNCKFTLFTFEPENNEDKKMVAILTLDNTDIRLGSV
ncbi:hypothetical protein PQX77_009359 [Marasmius sp. AFHP31]|nr:hypothetical protein PQX77_009359 [Marasmius sp. AFHP31]